MAEQNLTTTNLFWRDKYAQQIEPDLSRQDIELRNLFVTEYMHDRDAVSAALRCGFNIAFAREMAQRFMNESYVAQEIAKRERQEPEDPRQRKRDDELLVLSVLREAAKVGPYASRVAAAARMASILGLDAPSKSEQTVTHRGGVMACPGLANIEDWEKAAQSSQSKLVSDTREEA